MLTTAPKPIPTAGAPRFVTGSIPRHILVMTGTSAVGLMAIFFSDFANIFFLGLLGDLQLLAAVGYASSVLFFFISGGVGMAVAVTALVSPALGARDVPRARRLATHSIVFASIASVVMVAAFWFILAPVLGWLGADGRTLMLAHDFLRIVLPSLPPLVAGMCASAVLRSAGHPQRAMYITLTGAVVGTALDAVLILWLGLGIYGAALSSFIANVAILGVGWWGAARVHGLLARPDWTTFAALDSPHIVRFAVPAVLTNLATPAGGAFVTIAMSHFSDSAVAGWAVIGRLIPVAFGAILSLSGSIGAIVGQNFGARKFDRVRETLSGGIVFAAVFSIFAWLVLMALASTLVALFKATGDAAQLITFFCRWLAPLFAFFGTLFVCNAACNTLGRPHYATALSWGRATLGTVPFVILGSRWGATGALTGHMAGGIAFGLGAVAVVRALIARLESDEAQFIEQSLAEETARP